MANHLLKYLLFAIVLSLSFLLCKAQYQTMFGESYTEWNYITRYCDAGWINTYSCSRDTLIDGESYKIIDGLGYVKESSENEKMWLRRTPIDSALLIFDLSLSTGDSLFFEAGIGSWIAYMLKMD